MTTAIIIVLIITLLLGTNIATLVLLNKYSKQINILTEVNKHLKAANEIAMKQAEIAAKPITEKEAFAGLKADDSNEKS